MPTPEPAEHLGKRAPRLDLQDVSRRALDMMRQRRVWTTMGWVFSSYGLGAALAMALWVVLTHSLTKAEIGVRAATLGLAMIFEVTVMARGSETALSLFARKAHTDPGPWGALALELIVIDLLWLVFCVAGYLGVVYLFAPPKVDPMLLTLLALGTLLQFAWGACKAGQIVFEPVRKQAQLETLAGIAAFVLPATGVVLGGYSGYGWGMVVLGAMRSALAIAFAWPRLRTATWPRWRTRQVEFSELKYLGGLAILRAWAVVLSGQLDVLLLAASARVTAVASYSVARSASGTPARLLQPVWTLARKAVVTGIHHGGIREARGQITLAALIMLALGAPAFLVVFLWGPGLLSFVFGKDYGDGALALAILLPSSWFFDVMTGWARFAAAVAPRKLVTTGAFIGRCVICWVLWLIFKPHDPTGMAWIVAISNVATALVFWLALFNDHWLIGAAPQPSAEVSPLDGPEPG